MQAAIEQFRANIQRTRSIGSIYQALNSQTTQALDLSDLLRSEWVMAVSALDHYVHELVRLGMMEAYHGKRPQTDAFLRFQITIGRTLQAVNTPTDDSWLEDQIRASHGHLSFQTPDNIADAVRLVSDAPLWNTVAARLNVTPQYMRERVRLIVSRRNQIAHEADTDPSYGGRLWPVDFAMVDDAVSFIEGIAEVIYAVVA